MHSLDEEEELAILLGDLAVAKVNCVGGEKGECVSIFRLSVRYEDIFNHSYISENFSLTFVYKVYFLSSANQL